MNTQNKSIFKFLSWLNISQKGMVLVMVPLFFEFCFIGALGFLLFSAEQEIGRIHRAQQAILGVHDTKLAIAECVAFLGSDDSLGDFSALERLTYLSKKLSKPLVDPKDFPELSEVIKAASVPKSDMKAVADAMIAAITDPSVAEKDRRNKLMEFTRKNKTAILQIVFEMKPLDDRTFEIESTMDAKEPEEQQKFQNNLMMVVTGGVLLSWVLSLLVGWGVTNNIFGRLQEIAYNAQRISWWEALPAAQEGTDEIAQLDSVLHESGEILKYIHQKEYAILENAASLICSLDSRFKFLEVSSSITPILEMQPEDVIGMSFFSLLRADVLEKTRLEFEQLTAANDKREIETIIRRKDRSYIECMCTVSWSAEKKQYFCVIHDVTQQKSVERLKQHLISIVSHDLRAPLTAVLINLGIMMDGKRGPVSEKVMAELKKSEKSLTRLMALVNDLLELEKLGLGKEEIEKECISAASVCRQAREALESLATRSNVRIQNPYGDAAILGNENRLVQVVVNLLSNAIKFSPPESVIKFSINSKNNMVEIGVADEGPGIPPEEQALIFERFHQGKLQPEDQGKTTKSTGLGLAIVKSLVKAHGGECGVECGNERGSRFWIRIPEFIDPLEETT